MKTLHVRIVTPKGVYKELDTDILNVQTTDGDRGFLAEHMPTVTMLKIGKMTTNENGKREEYAVAAGLLYLRDNTVEILTDAIENKSEIDEERARHAMERAEERIESNDSNIDMARAELALKKAMNRLSVAGK